MFTYMNVYSTYIHLHTHTYTYTYTYTYIHFHLYQLLYVNNIDHASIPCVLQLPTNINKLVSSRFNSTLVSITISTRIRRSI